MKYIFCDSDNGGTPTNATPDTSTSKYHTTSTWPANGARWSSIATAVADTTIVGLADDLTIYIKGANDFQPFALTTLTAALSVTIEGDATGAVWNDTKATVLGSPTVGGCIALALSVPQTLKYIQLNNTQGTGTPRGAYCNGTGAAILEGLKIKFTGTSITNGVGIVGTSAPPVSVTAKNCIVDGTNPNTAATYSGISLQTATVGNFYNCVFRGAATGATNPDNCVNCVFFGFATQGGSSGNYKYCYTVNGTGTNPVGTITDWTTVFLDYLNFDYRLKAGSALIGVGIGPTSDASVPITDIASNIRFGTTTDVGAAIRTFTITSVDGDDTVYNNQFVNITGSGFGTTQGLVFIDGVSQTINSWSDTNINIIVNQSTLPLGLGTLKIFKPM